VFQVQPGTLTPDDERKISYHVRAKRGNLLFAKSWLLVEGESEFWFLPEAAHLLNFDFELEGVCCVEFAQCGLTPLIKLATDLGIEWHVLADGDPAGQRYATTARGLRGTAPEPQRLTVLAEKDIEHAMWAHGYSTVYNSAVGAPQRANITAVPGSPPHTEQTIRMAISSTSKPHLAIAAVEAAQQAGSPGLPASIQTAITTAVNNARL
jgi:putative ATP-dependent endonuclease of OLD family